MTLPLFRLRNGNAVYPCKCCDGAVEIHPDQERENVNRGYYIRSHAYIGAAYELVGPRYEFELKTLPVLPGSTQTQTPSPPTPQLNERGYGAPIASYVDEWDADRTTPVMTPQEWDDLIAQFDHD